MHHGPVVFALRDAESALALAVMLLVLTLAKVA